MPDVSPGVQNEMLGAVCLAGRAVLAAFCLYVSLTSAWPFPGQLHHTRAADSFRFTWYNTKLLTNIGRERDDDRALLVKREWEGRSESPGNNLFCLFLKVSVANDGCCWLSKL